MDEIDSIKSGALTEQMDVGSAEFYEFQAILLNKSRKRTANQKLVVEFMAVKYQMEDYLNSESQEILNPGEFLKSYLRIIGVNHNKFAKYIGLQPSNFSKLINGERPINYELAFIFGEIFNVPAILWLKIQAKNELMLLKKASGGKFKKYSLKGLVDMAS